MALGWAVDGQKWKGGWTEVRESDFLSRHLPVTKTRAISDPYLAMQIS